MAEDIRLAKGEDVDALKEQMKEKVDIVALETDGYLKRKIVGALPYLETDISFADSVSKFTTANRISATIENDAVKGNCQKFVTASNAANAYAFAYLDFSELSIGAKKLTVEFDSKIDNSRWFIGLSDLSQRPGTSSRATYDGTGVVIHHGTKDGSYFYINGTNTRKTTFFNTWVHSTILIDFEAKTVTYKLSNGSVTDLLTGTVDFNDASVEQVTGMELYSYVNGQTAYIGDIKISAQFGDETDERTLYIIREEDGSYAHYIYIDNKPIPVGKSNIVEMYEALLKRVEALENGQGG